MVICILSYEKRELQTRKPEEGLIDQDASAWGVDMAQCALQCNVTEILVKFVHFCLWIVSGTKNPVVLLDMCGIESKENLLQFIEIPCHVI